MGRILGEGRATLRRIASDAGSLVGQARTNRNMIRFVGTQVVHPRRLHIALGAYRDSMARQGQLFIRQQVDDISDAMRHAGASARVVDRVARGGSKPQVAAEFMRRMGRAHELDSSLTGIHRELSIAQDLHNNELGIATALRHLDGRRGPSSRAGEQALEGAVLRALAEGRGRVLDSPTGPLRRSTADELARVLRDPANIA